MNLDTTTRSLEVKLGEAITTSQCDITASFGEYAAAGFRPRLSDTVTNGVTAVTAVAAPATSEQLVVQEVRVYNADTVSHLVVFQLNDNGTIRIIEAGTVEPGATFSYLASGPANGNALPALLLESGTTSEKISALAAAATLAGTELVVVVQGGADVQATAQDILNVGTMVAQTAGVLIRTKTQIAGASDGIYVASGDVTGAGASGFVGMESGAAESDTGALFFGSSTPSIAGDSGSVSFYTGDGVGVGKKAGDYVISLGLNPAGTRAYLIVNNVVVSDPGVPNALFIQGGFVVQSGNNTQQESVVLAGSAVALTTGTPADVTTVTLAAGRWAIFGAVYFTGNALTTVTRCSGGLNTLAVVPATPGAFADLYVAGAALSVIGQDIAVTGMAITDLGGATTWHLVAQADFAVNTLAAYGRIFAVPII